MYKTQRFFNHFKILAASKIEEFVRFDGRM